jgi:hypothetical protein
MANRHHAPLSAAILLAVCSAALGVENVPSSSAGQALERAFPGVRFHEEQGRLTSIYGVPMTSGATAVEAATTWINQYGAAFGCGNLELTESWSCPIQNDRFTVFTYQQYLSGIPVEYGMLKVLVLNGATPRVVYAAGTLAAPPQNGLNLLTMDAGQAVAGVRATQARNMSLWSAPALAVYQGEGPWTAPVLTWKVTGASPNPSDKLNRTFFVNATTGAIESIRDEVVYDDVTGTVNGMGTPGLLPDTATNPPVSLAMPEIKVGITGGNTAFGDRSGNFTVSNAGTAPVTVGTGIGTAAGFGGKWANVVPTGSTSLALSLPNITPPGPATFLFNDVPVATNTAQVNAFIVTNAIHDYFRDRAPNFTGIDVALRVNTGVSGTCNAFFQAGTNPPSTASTNFYNAGGGCPNTAYTTVAAHEYGHFIVNRLNRAQGAFGEGYGDTSGELLYDDNGTGRGFFSNQPTAPLRDPIVSNVQYPCSNSDPHYCGMMLSGVWWRIRTNMGTVLGTAPGLTFTQQLEVSWSLMTVGGPGGQAIAPQTAIEVLTVDDNDGNLANGTPDYAQICPAFAHHNVQCPTITQTCYANCDGSTTAPILNANDFICFQAAFAAGASYANCDGSTTPPVLNVNDFICFQAAFSAGCP